VSRSVSVADPAAGQTRLLTEQCKTCIFRPGNRMHLNAGRIRQVTGKALADESYVVCHSTLPGDAPPGFRPAVCRGFYDRFSTQALQIAHRLWGFLLVALPGMRPAEPGEVPPPPGSVNPARVIIPKRNRRRPPVE
jgi:hypothetical protein